MISNIMFNYWMVASISLLFLLALGISCHTEYTLHHLALEDPYQLIRNAVQVQDVNRKNDFQIVHVVGKLVAPSKDDLQEVLKQYAKTYKKTEDDVTGDPCAATAQVPPYSLAVQRAIYKYVPQHCFHQNDTRACWKTSSTVCGGPHDAHYLPGERLSHNSLKLHGTHYEVEMGHSLHRDFGPYLEPLSVSNSSFWGCEGQEVQDLELKARDCYTHTIQSTQVTGIHDGDWVRSYRVLRPLEVTIVARQDPTHWNDRQQVTRLNWSYRVGSAGLGVYLVLPGRHSPDKMARAFEDIHGHEWGIPYQTFATKQAWIWRAISVVLLFVALHILTQEYKIAFTTSGPIAAHTFLLGVSVFLVCWMAGAWQIFYVPLRRNVILGVAGILGVGLTSVAQVRVMEGPDGAGEYTQVELTDLKTIVEDDDEEEDESSSDDDEEESSDDEDDDSDGDEEEG